MQSNPNCISVWLFESGAMLTDEKGNNDLTLSSLDYPPLEDTVVYKQGGCSAKFTYGDEEPYTIADGDLSAGFPLKNGSGKTTFSWVAWVYPSSEYTDAYLFGKMSSSYPPETALEILYPAATWMVSAGGNETDTGIAATDDTWHHVAVTYDGDTDQLTVRVYNESTGLTDSFQTTLTGGDVIVEGTDPWAVGDWDYDLTARIDELGVFDKVLTPAEIDDIRNGDFGDFGGATGIADMDAYTGLMLGCPL